MKEYIVTGNLDELKVSCEIIIVTDGIEQSFPFESTIDLKNVPSCYHEAFYVLLNRKIRLVNNAQNKSPFSFRSFIKKILT